MNIIKTIRVKTYDMRHAPHVEALKYLSRKESADKNELFKNVKGLDVDHLNFLISGGFIKSCDGNRYEITQSGEAIVSLRWLPK